MQIDAIRTMYDYDKWATGRIFDVAAGLTLDELNLPGNAGHGSIRETLLHQITAKKGWLSWWDGSMSLEESISYHVELEDYPDLAAVRALWDEVEAQTSRFVDGLSEEDALRVFDVDLPWGLPPTTFTLWQMMLHVAIHGTQHRGEVAAMLTMADRSPGDLDLLFYFLEQIRSAAG